MNRTILSAFTASTDNDNRRDETVSQVQRKLIQPLILSLEEVHTSYFSATDISTEWFLLARLEFTVMI